MATFDYRDEVRGWGRDISYRPLPGNRLDAVGWGPTLTTRLSRGDFVLLTNPKGGETRYVVAEIRYASDPRDQWFATLAFAPRRTDAR